MTDIHRIRLRGPWRYEPLARYELLADGSVAETTSDLPAAGLTTVPSDWRQSPLGADYCGRVRYRRGFACPSGLAPEVMVSLVVELAAATGDVRLNGSPVGVVRGGGGSARFDITARLQDRNELQIDVTRPPPATVDRAAAAGGVLGEVRLEIQSGCTGKATGQPLDRGDMPPGAEPA